MTHLSLLLLLSLRPVVWQSTSSRLACCEIKQMLETNWKMNLPRDGIEAGEQQSDDVRRNLFRALSQAGYSSKLRLTSQPTEAFENSLLAVELEATRAISRRVSCEKITRGCYDEDQCKCFATVNTRSQPLTSLCCVYTVLRSDPVWCGKCLSSGTCVLQRQRDASTGSWLLHVRVKLHDKSCLSAF